MFTFLAKPVTSASTRALGLISLSLVIYLVSSINVYSAEAVAGGAASAVNPSAAIGDSHASAQYESELLSILQLIQVGDLVKALVAAERHLQKFPNSRVGHLLKADILLASSSPLLEIGQTIAPPSKALEELKHQIKNRWQHLKSNVHAAENLVPDSLLDMGRHKYVIVTDMQAGRLYLYENRLANPVLIRDYYLTVGSAGFGKQLEGDNKTPVGVYSIYQHIAGSALPDLYGKGAFPVNYPNRFDRALNRTGYGIWLHGTPSDTYARSPWASEGCFVLSNDDLLDIQQYIDAGSRMPVILSDQINWISLQQLARSKSQYRAVLENWKRDWESLNTQAYLAHYSEQNFNFGKADFRSWAKRKQQVNRAKTFVQVDLDIQSMFMYPGEPDMFVVQYQQRYLSNNYAGRASKQQYWQRDSQGQWKIIFEG